MINLPKKIFNKKNTIVADQSHSLSSAELIWLSLLGFAVVMLGLIFWFSIYQFSYWRDIENNLPYSPIETVQYNYAGAERVLSAWKERATEAEEINADSSSSQVEETPVSDDSPQEESVQEGELRAE